MLLPLAWRNLWRNKRRTAITLASVFLGVVLCTFTTSMQEGSYAQYIKAIVNFYSGYMQVHQAGYWKEKQLSLAFEYGTDVSKRIASTEGVSLQAPRLESTAFASSKKASQGVMLIGIEPDKEKGVTKIHERVKSGSFLLPGDSGLVMGQRLAAMLNVVPGDTLLLSGRTLTGLPVAKQFVVRGIVKHPSPDFDRQLVYLDISACQNFFAMPGKATSVVIMLSENADLAFVKNQLTELLGPSYEVMDWKELNRLMVDQIASDRVQTGFLKGILYMLVAFGILGTLIMMLSERRREFGMMMASGMGKPRLYLLMLAESMMLGLLGAAIGLLISLPVISWFSKHPVPLHGDLAGFIDEMGFSPYLHFSNMASIYFEQALIVSLLCLVLSLYSLIYIRSLKLPAAIRPA
jgi:ABC-type lipoprotein release transport system permease subunit